MLEIRNRILQIRKEKEISWEQWATSVHKTAETLKKQTAENANPTVETLIELLAPLGAKLIVMTEEEKAAFDNLPIVEQHCADLEKQIEIFEDNRKAKEEEILKLSSIIDKQSSTISTLQNRVIEKDIRLERKDDFIHQLLKEKGVIRLEKEE